MEKDKILGIKYEIVVWRPWEKRSLGIWFYQSGASHWREYDDVLGPLTSQKSYLQQGKMHISYACFSWEEDWLMYFPFIYLTNKNYRENKE